jgi:hypothetical protein
VYNAPLLTLITLLTLKKTKNVNYEVIVLDNASKFITKLLLKFLYYTKFIDKLITSSKNTFFAKGNNIAVEHSNQNSQYILLLNSDVKIKNPDWLSILLSTHKYGISSIGVCDIDKKIARCDGYCFLINKELYLKYKLDENYKWFYGITKLQTQVMKENTCTVKGYIDDNSLIKHYWGGSGKAYKKVLTVLPEDELNTWFVNCNTKLKIEKITKTGMVVRERERERE